MAQIIDDSEAKLLTQIRALGEGKMKEKLLETFLNTMHNYQGRSSRTVPKTEAKALFIDASFEKNTRAFQ